MRSSTRKGAQFMVIACLALAMTFLVGTSSPKVALAEEPENLKLISVSGQAEVFVKPDVATIRFGVETNASTANEAQNLNASLMAKMVQALKDSGIANEDIQTSNFSLNPVYEQGEKPGSKQVLVGYRCNNTVSVRVKNIARIGDLIDIGVKNGATNVSGISFGLLDPKAYQAEVLSQAVKDARIKAEIMASAAGVSITGVYRMSDGYVSVDEGNVDFIRGNLAKGLAGTPIEAGTIMVRASVRVDFSF